MSEPTTKDQLIELFKQTAEAHHTAYAATDGAHPDWPIWYAEYMHADISKLLRAKFTVSELVYLLVGLDKEIQLQAPGAYWPAYYARSLMARYL